MTASASPALQICLNCAFANAEAMSFCGRCGAPLSSSGQQGFASQERRRLTVLFCDLVGSTALSERMDIEEFEDLLRRYQEGCTAIVRSHDGFVARYVGDALLVYFGYPRALEDAPAQAVRAALAIVASVATLEGRDARGRALAPAVRVGIATGDVVVGDLVGHNMIERAAVRGLAANLAAKLQGVARPNAILVSDETRRRMPATFEMEDLGPLTIPGLERAERVYRVLQERQGPHSGITAQLRGGAAVGRDAELDRLHLLWDAARAGAGALVAISGEPGIGKSRLVREFRDRVRSDRQRSLCLTCSPNHRDTAFYPVATELRRLLRLRWNASAEATLARLHGVVVAAGLANDAVPLLADLLLVDPGPAYPRELETPPRRRERLLDVLAALLRHFAGQRPLLMVIEDAQWADPSTAETAEALLARLRGMAHLCLVTYRAESPVGWLERLSPETLALARLDPACSAGLALAVTGATQLPSAILTGIVERADGVPLFIEELTKNALEAQNTPGGEVNAGSIPSSLQESLVARLDRMANGKAVAQVASVIGRRFSRSLLERVAPIPARQLRAGLTQLVVAGLVSVEREGPHEQYYFRHALVRDTAYSTLLMRVRRGLHRDVATALRDGAAAPEPTAAVADGPEILAQHLTLAEDWAEAAAAWSVAGQRSYERLELAEAITQFGHGLDVVRNVADPADRQRLELALNAGFGAACMLMRGYAAPEVRTALTRAQTLSGGLQEPGVFPVLWGIWAFQIAARLERFGEDAANRLSQIAATSNDRALLVLAHAAQAATRGALGDLSGSERAARGALALYDAQRDHNLALTYTIDPKALSLLFLHHALWIQGRPDEAAAVDADCLRFARGLGHSFVVPYVLVWGGAPLVYAGRNSDAIVRMQEGVALARAGRFDLWSLTGELWRGAAMIGTGALAEGAALLEQMLAAYQPTGVRLAVPYLECILATALVRLGRAADAVALAEAAVTEGGRDAMHSAEIRRLYGTVLLAADPGQRDRAAAQFRMARDIARGQGARAWEARAAASLAALERGETDIAGLPPDAAMRAAAGSQRS